MKTVSLHKHERSIMEPQKLHLNLNLNQKITILNTPIGVNKLLYFPQRESTPNHMHSYIELYYNAEGTSVLKMDFNKQISVDKNQWVLLRRNLVHEEVVYGRCAGFSLGIETDPQGAALLLGKNSQGYCTGFDNQQIGWLLRQIANEHTQHPIGYAEYSNHLLSLLLLNLCRRYDSNLQNGKKNEKTNSENIYLIIDSFFNRIFQYQLHTERESLTIEQLAEQLHMSTRHVNRILQKHYGMSFRQMHLATRIRFTEYLLIQTNHSVSEICEICDLSEAYLFRCFKENYGMTPGQYRKMQRQ